MKSEMVAVTVMYIYLFIFEIFAYLFVGKLIKPPTAAPSAF